MKSVVRKDPAPFRCGVALLALLMGAQQLAQAQSSCFLPAPDPALPNLSPSDPYWNSKQLPSGWRFGIGPNLYSFGSTYTGVGDAMLAAAAQWSNVVPGREFGWDGVLAPTASDCPSNNLSARPFQIGASNFSTTTNCLSLNKLKASIYYTESLILAYADFNTYVGCEYPQCGTKSVTINLARTWTTSQTPLPGVQDLQSVLVHELGHSLGLAHMSSIGFCSSNDSVDCEGLDDNVVPSMQNEVRAGQVCQRTIKGSASSYYGDYRSIKELYPFD